jgi:biopolymer transport protein ExbB
VAVVQTDVVGEMLKYLQAGGGVLIPLTLLSLWMWILIFQKLILLYRFRRESILKHGNEVESCQDMPLNSWQHQIWADYQGKRTQRASFNMKLLDFLARRQIQQLEQHTQTIVVIATAAPLLGLIGTVTGMIKTFDVISAFGTGNVKSLASGIAEALITTQGGLVVAIPGLFMGNFIHRRVQGLRKKVEAFCLQLWQQERVKLERGEAHP